MKLFSQTIEALINVVDNQRIGKNTLELFWWEIFEQDRQNGGKISMGQLRERSFSIADFAMNFASVAKTHLDPSFHFIERFGNDLTMIRGDNFDESATTVDNAVVDVVVDCVFLIT